MLVPIPIGKTYRAEREGSAVKIVSCESCGEKYGYRVFNSVQSEAFSPGFRNDPAARVAALDGASDGSLRALLERSIRLVPCPHCGWYQAEMVRYKRRFWKPLAFVGGIALLSGAGVAYVLLHGLASPVELKTTTAVLAKALAPGITLLMAGGVIRFVYDPNSGDRTARKALGRAKSVDAAELATALALRR